MSGIRVGRGKGGCGRVRIGAPDPTLTGNGGMVAVTELCDRLDVIAALDAAVGPIKQRDRGFGAGELLVAIASAQLAGQDFLVGLDRVRTDATGQTLSPVPGLASTTGPRPRPHWLPTWAVVSTIPAPPRPNCSNAPWRGCRDGSAVNRSRCAPTPATSPGSWPAPLMRRTSRSRSAPNASPHCGGCCPGSPKPIGVQRSTCKMGKSQSLTTHPPTGPVHCSAILTTSASSSGHRCRIAKRTTRRQPRALQNR